MLYKAPGIEEVFKIYFNSLVSYIFGTHSNNR